MSKYQITIQEVVDKGERYPDKNTLYEQTVEGDYSIVPSIMRTVLDYVSTTYNPPYFFEAPQPNHKEE